MDEYITKAVNAYVNEYITRDEMCSMIAHGRFDELKQVQKAKQIMKCLGF
jgi:hypothetical protein